MVVNKTCINGIVYALDSEGYVDIIKDNFVIKSEKIKDKRFKIDRIDEGATLRIRLFNSRWKFVKPRKNFLKIVILPYKIIAPYLIIDGIITKTLMLLFDSPLLDKVNRIKFWRK